MLKASRLSLTNRNCLKKINAMLGISPPAPMMVLSSLRCCFAAWASVRLDGPSVSRLPFAHTGSSLRDAESSRDPAVCEYLAIALPNLMGPCCLLPDSECNNFNCCLYCCDTPNELMNATSIARHDTSSWHRHESWWRCVAV